MRACVVPLFVAKTRERAEESVQRGCAANSLLCNMRELLCFITIRVVNSLLTRSDRAASDPKWPCALCEVCFRLLYRVFLCSFVCVLIFYFCTLTEKSLIFSTVARC